MKNVLCYTGIILLLGLFLFPPILRLTLPERKEEDKKIDMNNYILSCSNQRFVINTSYEQEKIKMIVIKKIYTKEEIDRKKHLDENIENLDEQLLDPDTYVTKYQEIVKLYDDIKDKTTINHEISNDGEVVSIDFSVNDHKELEINKITQPLESQQKFYERLDFVCTLK